MIVSSSQHPGTPSYAAAELTWGLVLAAVRQIPQQMAALKAGQMADRRRPHAARQDARHLRLRPDRQRRRGYGKAFGMNVLVWGRERSRERARADGYAVAPSKEAFFAECDVLSLHMRWSRPRAASSRRPTWRA